MVWEPESREERPEGRELAVRDPSTNELDALDRLLAGGLAAGGLPSGSHAGGESDTQSLARIAFAVSAAAGDDFGLNVARTWSRIAAGIQATPQRGGVGFPAGLARLVAGSGRRGWGGLSLATTSLAAVLVLTIAAVLSVLVLSGGRAQAGFLETVDQLSAASATRGPGHDHGVDTREAGEAITPPPLRACATPRHIRRRVATVESCGSATA